MELQADLLRAHPGVALQETIHSTPFAQKRDGSNWPSGDMRLPQADVSLRVNSGRDVLAASLSGFDRYCRKKILRGSSSNIDSRRASNAQDRFKNPACAILLLRVVRVAPTFSTASARLRHAVMSAPCRLSGANRTHCAHFELSRS